MELARHYSRYSRSDHDSPITRQRYRELLDQFEPYRQSNRILDMGCNNGHLLEEAERRNWDVYGSKLEPRALEIVRGKGLQCAQAPVSADTFAPGSFDVITAFEVVEHLRDPTTEAATIARVLRPGGLFYCTTPNFASISRRLLRGRWSVISYPEHLIYFTPATLRSWLTRFEFTPIRLTTGGISPGRYRRALLRNHSSDHRSDEGLREQVESSRLLHMTKSAINSLLRYTQAGDTIKGCFELRPGIEHFSSPREGAGASSRRN